MNAIGTGYRVLGACAVVATAGLAAVTIAEGHVAAAALLAVVGGALAGTFWAVGGVINGGVGA